MEFCVFILLYRFYIPAVDNVFKVLGFFLSYAMFLEVLLALNDVWEVLT